MNLALQPALCNATPRSDDSSCRAAKKHAACSLNTRPRQTLGDMTPSDKLDQVLQ
jgi:hypothetical protein